MDELIADGQIERCGSSLPEARLLLTDAEHYLEQLRSAASPELDRRHRLAFRAMASTAAALLAAQGLCHTAAGGLDGVHRAISAQFGGGLGPGVFDGLADLSLPLSTPTADGQGDDDEAQAAWAVKFGANLLEAGVLRRFVPARDTADRR